MLLLPLVHSKCPNEESEIAIMDKKPAPPFLRNLYFQAASRLDDDEEDGEKEVVDQEWPAAGAADVQILCYRPANVAFLLRYKKEQWSSTLR